MKLGQLELGAGRPVVAVSFTDADGVADLDDARLAGVALAELRIDHFARFDAAYVSAQIKRLHGLPVLATIRLAAEGGGWKGSETDRLALYQAILPQVDAIDVELQATETLAALIPLARGLGKPVVVSHHDFDATPTYEALTEVVSRAHQAGADIVKIAAQVHSDEDISTLSRLLTDKVAPDMVIIGMGEKGLPTRLMFPGQGSRFTFAAKGDRISAPGQLPYDRMVKLLAEIYPEG
jgi:3-dehydroquinate dehydratase-1